jgi:methylthioribose-1-phosphate isomerase
MSEQAVLRADNVRLSEDGKSVVIMDQTWLPNETVYLTLHKAEELYDAIYQLRVRGAPAIGIFAAYALYVLSLQSKETTFDAFYQEFARNRDYLNTSRPTAVNLSAMLFRMDKVALTHRGEGVPGVVRPQTRSYFHSTRRYYHVPQHLRIRADADQRWGRYFNPLQCGSFGHVFVRNGIGNLISGKRKRLSLQGICG